MFVGVSARVGGWSFGVLNSLLVKNSTPSAEQQSLTFFMMHLFAISSWIYYFLFKAYPIYRLLEKKSGMEPHDFRSADRLLFIIIKDPLFFLFAPLGFLGSTEPRLFSTSSTGTSYRLLDMLPNCLFLSCRFTYAMFIVPVQANKGMKVNESRKHP